MQTKILIIEDEKMLADMYADKFNGAGLKVFLAGDVEEGIIKTKKEKPDLILLDILLPKENGISFLTRLRKDPDVSNTMVIAFSNYDVPDVKAQAKELGVIDYLIKTNYTPQEITDKIATYLKK